MHGLFIYNAFNSMFKSKNTLQCLYICALRERTPLLYIHSYGKISLA
jgi:hypothetical protein